MGSTNVSRMEPLTNRQTSYRLEYILVEAADDARGISILPLAYGFVVSARYVAQ